MVMNRTQKLLNGLDLANSAGIEIGALCNPLLKKSEANILYVDYADSLALRKHYAGNPLVDPDKIVETDIIWGTERLENILDAKVGFILASHVIEHVPDLVKWLDELHGTLLPSGEVRLAIPDKRFTFDILRRPSELAEVLAIHLAGPRVPQPYHILDYYLNATAVDAGAVWRGEVNEKLLQRPDNLDVVMKLAASALEDGAYHDAHCWVFTPQSFALLLAQLGEKGLVKFACNGFFDTEEGDFEFFVSLKPSVDAVRVSGSWRAMAAECRKLPCAPAGKIDALNAEVAQYIGRLKLLEEERDRHIERERLLMAQCALLENAVASACDEVNAIRQSRFWRITQPLRALLDSVKGRTTVHARDMQSVRATTHDLRFFAVATPPLVASQHAIEREEESPRPTEPLASAPTIIHPLVVANPQGIRVYVSEGDERGRQLISNGGFLNPPTMDVWKLLLGRDEWSHIIDVGANYGEMLVTTPLPGSAIACAFEPNPVILPCLQRTVAESGLPIRVIGQAVSNIEGTRKLFIDRAWSGVTRFAQEGEISPTTEEMSVRTTTLDVFLSSLDEPLSEISLLLKIDVEGHEISVLEGITGVLPSLKRFTCLIEVLHLSDIDLMHLLGNFKIMLFNIPKQALVPYRGCGVDEFRRALQSPDIHFQDVVIERLACTAGIRHTSV